MLGSGEQSHVLRKTFLISSPNYFRCQVRYITPTLKLYEQKYLEYWDYKLQFDFCNVFDISMFYLPHEPTSHSVIGVDCYGVVKTMQVMS